MKKISIGDATVRLVARLILALTVLALIGQSYHVFLLAAGLSGSIRWLSPIFYFTFAELWFYGFDMIGLDPAWPGLLLVVACFVVLRKRKSEVAVM